MNRSVLQSRRFPLGGAAVLALALLVAGDVPAEEGDDGWNQWGGPHQDFHATSAGLADLWPEGGPPKIWSRELGDGYSAIIYDDARLYTMYRVGETEVVACLDSGTGRTVWERSYRSSPRAMHVDEYGRGPRATPLLAGDRLFTIGVAGLMHAIDKNSSKILWSHDLWGSDFGGNALLHGYSSSPIAYKDLVIVLVGAENASIVALRQDDGTIAWRAQSFRNSYSTPRIMRVDGETQLVAFMAQEVIGIDPSNGDLKWCHTIENQFEYNITMPTLVDEKFLFLSTYQVGALGLKLSNRNGRTEVEKVWSTRKIQFSHVTSVVDGDWIYGTSGLRAPAFLSAINVKTGQIAWRVRGFPKANCVYADGKLFILGEDGKLSLVTATPQGLTIHSEVDLFDSLSWTVPTIVGKRMFVRNRTHIMALDLG